MYLNNTDEVGFFFFFFLTNEVGFFPTKRSLFSQKNIKFGS